MQNFFSQAFLDSHRNIISILLSDKTTGLNIIWATDNYQHLGHKFHDEITVNDVVENSVIMARFEKNKTEQNKRVRQKGEVFTPSWVCNSMNNLIDGTADERETFCPDKVINWKEYVKMKQIEITCGEAPFLTSRYDAVSGEPFDIDHRYGLLDRKLAVIGKNVVARKDWICWAAVALQSAYGYEWQGDNLFIARSNVLLTVMEYYIAKYGDMLDEETLIAYSKIIAWNIWQMDGLKCVVPDSCKTEEIKDIDLFGNVTVITKACVSCKNGYMLNSIKHHNGIYCKIRDWEKNQTVRFADCLHIR